MGTRAYKSLSSMSNRARGGLEVTSILRAPGFAVSNAIRGKARPTTESSNTIVTIALARAIFGGASEDTSDLYLNEVCIG